MAVGESALAFTAAYWGDEAVVCRAQRGVAGLAVAQEFGVFKTWTQANSFARQLNKGLELSPEEEHELVADAMLDGNQVVEAANCLQNFWRRAPVLLAANDLQVESLLAQLQLAVTFCRLMRHSEPPQRLDYLAQHAQNAFDRALRFAPKLKISESQGQELCELLTLILKQLPFISTHSFTGQVL